MTDGQVAELFRLYADEPDQTFLDDATVAKFCEIGLEYYRDKIAEIDPSVLLSVQHFTLPQAAPVAPNQINLLVATDEGNVIYGTGAGAGQRIKTINSLYILKSGQQVPGTIFRPVRNYEEMTHSRGPSYYWRGSNIFFSNDISDTVAISFIPQQDLAFTTGAINFIDNLGTLHDLIALYAYRHYAIMDGAPNPMVDALIPTREKDLQRYLVNRTDAGAQYVADVTSTELY